MDWINQYDLNTNKDIMPTLNNNGVIRSCNRNAPKNYIDSKVFCPSYINNKFNGILAINKDSKIIIPSNTFMEKHHGAGYNKVHQIYNLINFSYDVLTTIDHHHIINEKCMLFANGFSGANFGHDMSVVLDLLKYYKAKNLKCKILIIEKTLEIPRMYEFLQLFFRTDQIIIMKLNKIYKVKELIIKERVKFLR